MQRHDQARAQPEGRTTGESVSLHVLIATTGLFTRAAAMIDGAVA